MGKRSVSRTCLHCGAEFLAVPAQVNRGNAKFCTKSCQVKDQHRRKLLSPGKREDHHWWKGGRSIDAHGYVLLNLPDGRKKEHIVVAERMIGRRLRPNECVHHKDENRQNNAESNLEVMTKGAHLNLHRRLNRERRRAAA